MQEQYAVPAVPRPTVAVEGGGPRFPVRRIFCVGRNYPEHAREMGFQDRAPPFFFTKPADAVVASGAAVPYPPRTLNLHHEIELVVALGRGGRDVLVGDALALVFGHAAPVAPVVPASMCGHPARGRIWLEVNGTLRQQGDLADMIWSVPEVIAELSTWFELAPGDLVFTGTPAGVGPLVAGDRVRGGVDGVGLVEHTVAAR
jgi:fumarylpyruvate hydrolase